MKLHKVYVAAYGTVEIVDVGDFLRLDECDPSASYRFETASGAYMRLTLGQSFRLSTPFSSVRITNLSAIAGVIGVVVGAGDFKTGNKVQLLPMTLANGEFLVASDLPENFLNAGQASVTTTVGQFISGESTRKKIILQASPTNTADIKIGGSNLMANYGLTLQPGQGVELNVNVAIYAVALAGTQTLEWFELRRI